MQKLLTLPPNLVESFHELTGLPRDEWFVSADPVGRKLGSGGGTAWLMKQWEDAGRTGRRIVMHAGGQSRRLPSYATSGKVLTPVPIFRWARGQHIDQTLLSLQLPLYERILGSAPESLTTLIASGDVYIRVNGPLQPVPDADVVCYGLWVDPELASHHGVFVSDHNSPDRLAFMLQKPSIAQLQQLSADHYFLMDVGVWLLSDKAMNLLARRCGADRPDPSADDIRQYDLYGEFGCALGHRPSTADEEVNSLTVAVVPLADGEFYHYGTSAELLSSTAAVQSLVADQRKLLQRRIKPRPTLFVQNCEIGYRLSDRNDSVWVENSHVPTSWTLTERNIVTGVPRNDWSLTLAPGICLDVTPVKGGGYAVRPYGFDDRFSGRADADTTLYLGQPLPEWLRRRGIDASEFGDSASDIQSMALFPVLADAGADMEAVVKWMTSDPGNLRGREVWRNARRLSADDISACADLAALFAQRRGFMRDSIELLAENYHRSVFYQLDLDNLAHISASLGIEPPSPLAADARADQRIANHMYRARAGQLLGSATIDPAAEQAEAFRLLREQMLDGVRQRQMPRPRLGVASDQIVWGRSPVRIDVAGGWTDTPPYSLLYGGSVVNMAVNINGQQPLQVYVKPSSEFHIVLRSIDMSATETLTDFADLAEFNRVGSPFSIPKAALALAGFLPGFSAERYPTLAEQLRDFGSGIEITLLSALPAGSGLGTSSILAATVLGALSDFCGLAWDANEICSRTLALEQLLTTGGGWQDQYGGVMPGIKLFETEPGARQVPQVSWLPDRLFTSGESRACHLLYYTGITRTAKNILAEIVRGMFLNSSAHLAILEEMKQLSHELAAAVQRNDFTAYGRCVGRSWELNKALDRGTNPPSVEAIIRRISDYCLGYKLPGAGGGGFLYMVAKDSEAAARLRAELTAARLTPNGRFVEMALSSTGFEVSRS